MLAKYPEPEAAPAEGAPAAAPAARLEEIKGEVEQLQKKQDDMLEAARTKLRELTALDHPRQIDEEMPSFSDFGDQV